MAGADSSSTSHAMMQVQPLPAPMDSRAQSDVMEMPHLRCFGEGSTVMREMQGSMRLARRRRT